MGGWIRKREAEGGGRGEGVECGWGCGVHLPLSMLGQRTFVVRD